MRWIGSLPSLELAQRFVRFLRTQGVESAAEKSADEQSRIWIVKEDQVELAQRLLDEFQQQPGDARFHTTEPPRPIESLEERASEAEPIRSRVIFKPITLFISLVCIILLIVQQWQEVKFEREHPVAKRAVSAVLVPIQEALMIQVPPGLLALRSWVAALPPDAPEPNEEQLKQVVASVPAYRGLWGEFQQHMGIQPAQAMGPILPEVRQGQVWRLFTPAVLHAGILHLAFNLIWWLYFGKQLEHRLGSGRYLWLILVGALGSNLAQYLVSGPDFLGLSGVVCAQAGFILMRERKAPWEGYPVPRSTMNFLVGFVLIAAILEGLFVLAQVAGSGLEVPISLGNAAHIVGGLVGMALGLLPYSRKRSVL